MEARDVDGRRLTVQRDRPAQRAGEQSTSAGRELQLYIGDRAHAPGEVGKHDDYNKLQSWL